MSGEKPEVFWPYNETFRHYHDVPLAGKRATNFVNKYNQCKGGKWVLHTTEQYDQWYKSCGIHQEAASFERKYNIHLSN